MGDSNENSKDHADQQGDAGGEFWQFLKFVMASCLLTALVFWPYTFGQLAVVWEPEVVTDVGTVQKIYFVGWLGFSTQIETETRTFLAWDIVNLPKGTPLQTQQDYFGRRVCVANTKRCWEASRR